MIPVRPSMPLSVLPFLLVLFATLSCNQPQDVAEDTSEQTVDSLLAVDTGTSQENPLQKTWTFASHDRDASPDYATVFPDDVVNRMDVVVTDSAWNVLMEDMTSMAGAFGAGEGTGSIPGGENIGGFPDAVGLPQELIDAAVGKEMGDSCTCSMMGTALSGIVDTSGGKNYCRPSMPGDIPGGGGEIPGGGEMENTEFLPREPVYIPATMLFKGKQWGAVGFRLKGNSSLSSAWKQGVYKLPFRIKTDEFEDAYPDIKNQRIYGFQDLSLCNNYMDNTMIHEKTACDLFRAFGVPAPTSTYIRLYVTIGSAQPAYFGLYTMDEMPDVPLLETWFGNHSGNLYKPDGDGARFVTYDESSFEEKNNDDNSNADIQALFTALHADRSDPATWRKNLDKVFDVTLFLKWLAVNTVIGNWDAYGSMPHNYYLYNNKGKLSWIAWDLGLSFSENGGMGRSVQTQDIGATITHAQVDSTWPLIKYLLDDTVYFSAYMEYVGSFNNTLFTPDVLTAKVQDARAMISPYVTGAEPEKTGYTYISSPADFETAHTSLVNFITSRSASVAALLTSGTY